MTDKKVLQRLNTKTPKQKLLQILRQDYNCSVREAEAILLEAEECLLGMGEVQPGQGRALLAKQTAPASRPLTETALTEVVWTIDAGEEDQIFQLRSGRAALRRQRIIRMLDEALEQGAAATQEDLAKALHVTVRTIKRDFAVLRAEGKVLPTRGYLKGVGRGQTHKKEILGRWLRGETYDQIALHARHSPSSIQRYVHHFMQVVSLTRRGYSASELAPLVQISESVVAQYLQIYAEHQTPASLERLEEQLQRFQQDGAAKRGL